jgi:hypothetical protein
MSSENAIETARLLNQIKPDFIRVGPSPCTHVADAEAR